LGGGDVGNWCENCIVVLFEFVLCTGAVAGAADCMVVRVVVIDRTDGAGEENVLSAPRPEAPYPIVAFVPSPEDGACDGATPPASVDIVAAIDLFPIVGGGRPSSDDRTDRLL
jgi:hypothetical protein